MRLEPLIPVDDLFFFSRLFSSHLFSAFTNDILMRTICTVCAASISKNMRRFFFHVNRFSYFLMPQTLCEVLKVSKTMHCSNATRFVSYHVAKSNLFHFVSKFCMYKSSFLCTGISIEFFNLLQNWQMLSFHFLNCYNLGCTHTYLY